MASPLGIFITLAGHGGAYDGTFYAAWGTTAYVYTRTGTSPLTITVDATGGGTATNGSDDLTWTASVTRDVFTLGSITASEGIWAGSSVTAIVGRYEPVLERIAQDVQAALESVDEGTNYRHTLVVQRAPRKINPAHLLAVLVQTETERHDGLTDDAAAGASGVIYWRQNFDVMLFIVQSDQVATPIDTALNAVRADVEKAIMVDPTRGGLAHDTVIQPPTIFAADNNAYHGIIVSFSVQFGTRGNDPCLRAD